MPYPANVVGLPVIDAHAGVIVTAVPIDVILPFASTENGLTDVAELLYVPAVTPVFARVKLIVPATEPLPVTSPDSVNA